MKGSEAKLLEYMEGAKKRFVIPVYQRNYDWKVENCKQLFDDLVKVVQFGRTSHFFGSIVSSYQPNGRYTEYLVIDGQQRLTTVSLLLLAMYNLLKEKKVIPQTETMAQEIFEDYLIDKHQPKETRIKLKPVKNDTYSVEHIMPQHLTPAWVEDLGADYEEIHTIWLHRLANLTLTAYNAKYSNSSFKEKRDMPNGFRESGLRMNTWIAQQEKWTLSELESRNENLMRRALEIWAMPATDYKPAEKQLDSCTLDDDVDLSGREIARFEYRNTEQPVSSWIVMMEQILKILHEEDRSVLTVLAHTHDTENDFAYISDNPAKLRVALEIDNGIYVERNTSTSTKISVLRKLFKAYGRNPEDLVFYLKEASEDKTAEEAGTRYELRRRYWAFALDYIKAAHGGDGAFSNVNPSKENWISGFFGISGFNISCVANQDESRVELVLVKTDKLLNKSAYDYLYARRAEIESKLGASLNWLRSDETKTSYVSCKLTDVSIANETDWLQMAKFHAEWSKKLYDIFVPYLKNWNAQTGDNQ